MAMNYEDILVKPLLTEKTTQATEAYNTYAFRVGLKANKNQIKEAVENLFDVKVQSVRTSVLPGRVKRIGKNTKKSSSIKKAFVTVAKDQKIEFFKGI
jgi:large subunit ribosomal protein L23